VDAVSTAKQGLSPNFNYVVGDSTQDTSYLLTVTATDLSRPWTQTYDSAQGEYTTSYNYNWYAAENNIWDSVYYNTNFSDTVGPEKIAPIETCSPFVPTSVLERQDLVSDAFQGAYAPDPYRTEYLTETYFRGATVPYTESSIQGYYDDDDSTNSLGLLLKDIDSASRTNTIQVIDSSCIVQTEQTPSQTANRRYRPEIIGFNVLSPGGIPSPRQTVSILKLSTPTVSGVEYLRVVRVLGSYVEAIRLNSVNSYFPDPPSAGQVWPSGTFVTVCVSNITPEARIYDPDWSPTRRALVRFFEVMGYPSATLLGIPNFGPRYWGERVVPVQSLPIAPQNGYATVTGKWPLEFNVPSTIIANTHNWMYCGYLNYSRGLPKYQTNDISRKLASDFLCTSLWGGRVTVTGVDESGEIVTLGPEREALTGQYWEPQYPTANFGNQQLYEQQDYVDFPNQVVVYSADNISSQFDGSRLIFDITRGGYPVPPAQLNDLSLFVQIGAVTQYPTVAYTVIGNQISFFEAPMKGASCDIRVVTSEDDFTTLAVVPLKVNEPFNGVSSVFTMSASINITEIEINNKNTFVFFGGTEQIPGDTYTISRLNDTTLQLTLSQAPPTGTLADIRAVCSGPYWSSNSVFPVEVYSLDDIAPLFDGIAVEFPLTYQGKNVNPETVDTENLFVSVAGGMQLPYTSYTVAGSKITFTGAPVFGMTSNLRVVTSSEFLPCPLPLGAGSSVLRWGPGILVNEEGQITNIDPGLVS
jgi:hypothetical protein